MAVELKAGPFCEQRLEKRLALDERQPRGVLAFEMQEIKGVIDDPRTTLAVAGNKGAA
jgi:hypothetical protein